MNETMSIPTGDFDMDVDLVGEELAIYLVCSGKFYVLIQTESGFIIKEV